MFKIINDILKILVPVIMILIMIFSFGWTFSFIIIITIREVIMFKYIIYILISLAVIAISVFYLRNISFVDAVNKQKISVGHQFKIDKKKFEAKFKKGNCKNEAKFKNQIIEQTEFFEKYCKNCSSNIAILKYNPLNNLLTNNKDGWHAYLVFSPTYVLKCLGLNVGAAFFDHVCLELQDLSGNIYKQESAYSTAVKKDKKRPYFSNSGICIGETGAHGDKACFDILIKNKADFNFDSGKKVKVRLFCNDSFDKENLIFEFYVVSEKAKYNLFSRLGEIPDFYREFKHPEELDKDFYYADC